MTVLERLDKTKFSLSMPDPEDLKKKKEVIFRCIDAKETDNWVSYIIEELEKVKSREQS